MTPTIPPTPTANPNPNREPQLQPHPLSAFVKNSHAMQLQGQPFEAGDAFSELGDTLGTLFIFNLIVGNIREVGVNLARNYKRYTEERCGVDPMRAMSMVENEYTKEPYDKILGPFDFDHTLR